MSKETYLPCLFQLFRQYGYDGVTLSKISQATGLGKASLYHHFPGGKEEMVEAVLDYAATALAQNVLQPLTGPGSTTERLQRMCAGLSELYAAGEQPCLLASLQPGSARDIFHERVKRLFQVWIEAIASVLMAGGMEKKLARERAEDAALAVQGSLLLSQSLDNPSIFQRVLEQLPRQICL